MSLRSQFEEGRFVVTVEISPVRLLDGAQIDEIAARFGRRVSAVNVTDRQNAGAKLSPLATCYLLRQRGVEPVFHATCRDRNRYAIQSELFTAHALGIENVLALTGDRVSSEDIPQAKPVFDWDSIELLRFISGLNQGLDMSGKRFSGGLAVFAGAALNPNDPEAELVKMEKKVAAGARFFQTQPIFDADAFARFMEKAARFRVPILAGITPLRSVEMARHLSENVPGISIPESLVAKMERAEDKLGQGIEIATELIGRIKGLCQGIHLMPIGGNRMVPTLLDAAGL